VLWGSGVMPYPLKDTTTSHEHGTSFCLNPSQWGGSYHRRVDPSTSHEHVFCPSHDPGSFPVHDHVSFPVPALIIHSRLNAPEFQ
jgi:hypothetical protein